jgi:hypothetical protein
LLSLEDREFHGVKKKNPLLENAALIKARRSSSNSRLNSIINTGKGYHNNQAGGCSGGGVKGPIL